MRNWYTVLIAVPWTWKALRKHVKAESKHDARWHVYEKWNGCKILHVRLNDPTR